MESESIIESRFESYLSDESGLGPGHAQIMFLPENERQIVDFLREMNARKIHATISGGRTGIVGGAVPEGGAVLSLDRMNHIVSVRWDEPTREWRVSVEPGIRLNELQERIARKDLGISSISQSDLTDLHCFQMDLQQYFYPPDPTEGSASLGGTLATDASGARTYHFGRTRKHIRALRIALASGDILEIRRGQHVVDSSREIRIRCLDGRDLQVQIPSYESPHLKTAAGYFCQRNMDLIDLFIGSEGTLGVITLIEIALAAAPEHTAMFLAFFNSETDVVRFVEKLRFNPRASSYLTVFSLEYFDSNCLSLLRKLKQEGATGVEITLPAEPRAAILCEFSYSDLPSAIRFLEQPLTESGSSLNNAISGTEEDSKQMLRDLRHAVPEAINRIVALRKKQIPGIHKIGTDTAVADQKLESMMQSFSQLLKASNLEHYVFGHIAENHLHVNLLPKTSAELPVAERLAEDLARQAVKLGGTVSAEHGIGKLKRRLLEMMFSGAEINQMRAMKRQFDPNLILCPDNMFQA
jgi:D-lactate dehydrogenase (cytochrome)